jgi:hypothetical protein
VTIHLKDTYILMKNTINVCHVDLQHAQKTKMKTKKTKTIQDYLGGSSLQKSTCSRQPVHGDTIDSQLLLVFLVTFATAIVALKNHDSKR